MLYYVYQKILLEVYNKLYNFKIYQEIYYKKLM
jgi:hypothetical protein